MSGESYSGTLEKTPLAQVLRKVYLARASGVLDLKQNRDQRMIALVEGEVRTARSNQLEKRVGQYALQNEVINRVELLRAMSVKEPGMPIGQKLVRVGALDEEGLAELLEGLVREIIVECFAWTQGEFRFRKGRPGVEEKVQIHVSTADIIHEGFKTHGTERRARRVIGDLNAPLIPNPNLRLLFQHVSLDSVEDELLAKIDGSQSAAELSITMDGDPSQNIITIGALLACGLLSTKRPGEDSTQLPNVFAQRVAPDPAAIPAPDEPAESAEPDESEKLLPPELEEAALRPKGPPKRKATVPKVAKETPASPEVKRPPVRSASQPKPRVVKPGQKPPTAKLTQRDIDLMRGSIREKYAIVNSRSYDYYTLLGLPYRTTQKEIYYSFTTLCMLCHPDLAHKEPFSDLKQELETVFEALEEAYETLMDASRRDTYDRLHRF